MNEIELGIPNFTREQFLEEMSKFNVVFRFVYDCDLGDENGFHSAQRVEFAKVKGRDILLLDSDTFIFSDVEPLFNHLRDYDLVADETEWGAHGGKIPLLDSWVTPFNSGVVLFKGDLLQRYGASLMEICLDIKHERSEIGKWYGDYERSYGNPAKSGREELALTFWAMREKLRYKYFDSDEVQTVKLSGSTIIYHTMTQNWIGGWRQFFRGTRFLPPKKMQKRLFLKATP